MSLIAQYRNHLHEYTSTVADTLEQVADLLCPDGQKMILIGFDVCNLLNTGIEVDVVIHDASLNKDFYWVKNSPVPVGGTSVLIEKQKQVLMPGDSIKVSCSMPVVGGVSPLHIVASSMEVSLVEE